MEYISNFIADLMIWADYYIQYFIDVSQVSSLTEFTQVVAVDIYDWTIVFALLFLTIELLDDGLNKRLNGERVLETLSSLLTQIPYYFMEVIVFGFLHS